MSQSRPDAATASDAAAPRQNHAPVVVVIDDQMSIAEVIAFALRQYGMKTEVAYDGLSGIEAVRRLRPDAVVADILMPGLDGIALAKALREISPEPLLILMSGDLEAVRAASKSFTGARAILDKPVPVRALVHYLKSLLPAA
jgi:CheY-like chemotaxis protein